MEGIIVVDMPKSCRECELRTESGYCIPTHKDIFRYGLREEKPDWCPIKPIPKRKTGRSLPEYDTDIHYEIGWNSCIDAIIGER